MKIDIIKHKQEVDGKSTSSHARIISPDHVTIYEYPNIPDYSSKEEVILIFPSTKSVSISSLFKGVTNDDLKHNHGLEKGFNVGTLLTRHLNEIMTEKAKEKLAIVGKTDDKYSLNNLPFKRAVFIDSTWKQCRSIYKDSRIYSIKSCVIQNRKTKFWRHQKGAPKWYLSTIEAIHQFLLETHVNAWGISQKYYNECLDDLDMDKSFITPSKVISIKECSTSNEFGIPYDGQYDNLLFFFSFLHSLINSFEDVNGKVSSVNMKN